jgi:flagellin
MLDFIVSSLGSYSDILNRMRTLATEANSSAMGTTQRAALDQEYQSLTGQLTAIAQNTKWLGTQLLNTAGNMVFQVGVSSTTTVTISTIDLTPATANFAPSTTNTNISLGSLGVNSSANAANALNNTTLAIQHISEKIANYGAQKAYLRYVADNLSSEIASKSETKSILLDADVTEELMNIQSHKAMFDSASVMFQQSLAKQEQIAHIVKQAST